MNEKDFNEKMNRKNLGEIAEEKVAAYLSSDCEDVDVLFSAVDGQLIDPADAEYIGSVLASALSDIADDDKQQNCLMTILHDASDGMSAVFMKMLHSMRKEYDYSGLGLLYESCDTDLPFRIYQRLGDMIFNDYFPAMNLGEHEKASPVFRTFYNRFDDYFGNLLASADVAWESYLQPADEKDNDEEDYELSYERFQQMIADSEAEDDAADDLMPSAIQLRVMKSTAFLMALAAANEARA